MQRATTNRLLVLDSDLLWFWFSLDSKPGRALFSSYIVVLGPLYLLSCYPVIVSQLSLSCTVSGWGQLPRLHNSVSRSFSVCSVSVVKGDSTFPKTLTNGLQTGGDAGFLLLHLDTQLRCFLEVFQSSNKFNLFIFLVNHFSLVIERLKNSPVLIMTELIQVGVINIISLANYYHLYLCIKQSMQC